MVPLLANRLWALLAVREVPGSNPVTKILFLLSSTPGYVGHGLVGLLCPKPPSQFASNLQSSERTKHIDVRHHFIKHHVANGDVALEYLSTEDQPADLLTKSLDRIKVSKFRQILLGRE